MSLFLLPLLAALMHGKNKKWHHSIDCVHVPW